MAETQPWMEHPVVGAPAAEPGGAANAQPWMDHPVVEAAPATEHAAESAPITAAGIAEQGGIGLAKGAIGIAGAPADTNSTNKAIGSRIGDKLGISPETQEKFGAGYDMAAKSGALGPVLKLGTMTPGAEAIRHGVESVTGPFREAQNIPEHYAERIGEFLPGLVGNRGGIVSSAVKNVILPAVASETAGQATKGTAAEPYARLGAAIAGGVAPSLLTRTAAKVAPTIQQVKDAAEAGYKSPQVAAVTFQPSEMEGVSNIIKSDLDRMRLNDRLAKGTHDILDDLKTPVNGSAHTIEDVQTTRTLLGRLAGNYANPTEQMAASEAIKRLDNAMATFPQSRVATGDITQANAALENARGNYASAKTAEKVQEKLTNAELQAASAHSGSNIDNATRQKLRTLLTSKSQGRGLTEDELQSVEDSVRGSALGNALRAGGKVLGGGGGLGALHSAGAGAGAGYAAGGLPGAILGAGAPIAGLALKKAGDAITRSNANKIIGQILSRSPLATALAAAAPPASSRLSGVNALPLVNAATLPLRLPLAQVSQPAGY